VNQASPVWHPPSRSQHCPTRPSSTGVWLHPSYSQHCCAPPPCSQHCPTRPSSTGVQQLAILS
jgi:hypothetical protein